MKKSELKQIIIEELNEALGVPTGIVSASTNLYNDFVKELKLIEKFKSKNEFDLKGEYSFADLKIKGIKIFLNLTLAEKYTLLGMNIRSEGEINPDFKISTNYNKQGYFEIDINISILKGSSKKDLISFIESKKDEMIALLTHEFKHGFDDFKKPSFPLSYISKYEAVGYHRPEFNSITPISDFLFNIYFTHDMENLVRPAEIASYITTTGVTKKEFYDFIINSKVFKELKKIQNFSYENLKKELIPYIPKIKKALERNLIPFNETDNNEKLIEKLLKLVYDKLIKYQIQYGEENYGTEASEKNIMNDYIKTINKFKDNYEAFYKNEENYFKRTATQIIKKLSKLYALTAD
jgi:hypothetical protein